MTRGQSTSDGARNNHETDAPTFLVAGDTRVDAGKTTFSTGLLAYLAGDESHTAAVGVKPRAGNDYWFDHDDVRISTGSGRLYGKDARRLATASTRPLDPSQEAIAPEAINPVHRLWRPTPGRTGMLGDSNRTFLCDRVTTPDGSRFVVNGVAEAEGLIPELLGDRLPLSNATRVDDIAAFNELMADVYVPAFNRLADRIGRASVPVVIESYADVAAPLSIGGDAPVAIDAVATVAPGRVRIYAGDRYAKARQVASGSAREGTLEEHTDAVTEMIEPLATVGVPALSGEERGRSETVAERYAAAYEALVDAAERV